MSFILMESSFGHDISSTSNVHYSLFSEISHHAPVVFMIDPDGGMGSSLELLIKGQGWRPEGFTSTEAFLGRPLELVPSCLLLDISRLGLSGLELQERLAGERADIPIIFLDDKCDVPLVVKAMKAGAAEFFMKPFQQDDLLTAIRRAHERSRHALVQIAEHRRLHACYASLSLREKQVMALVSSGLLNKQVASELGISEITVKAHRGQMMTKMRATSLADLVKSAAKLGVTKDLQMPKPRHNAERAANLADRLFDSYAFVP